MMNLRNSGYKKGTDQWIDFLTCWNLAIQSREHTGLASFIRCSMVKSEEALVPDPLIRNRTDLPPSVLDFHQAYRHMSGEYRTAGTSEEVRMIDVNEIQSLQSFAPDLFDIRMEFPSHPSDKEYFVYGMEQDSTMYRTSYSRNALVLAQVGGNYSELMLLYPDVVTSDGEMEVAILGQSWEFRAPSFAEMMRQLSFLCLTDPEYMPPYRSEVLGGTCADNIHLTDVWWS